MAATEFYSQLHFVGLLPARVPKYCAGIRPPGATGSDQLYSCYRLRPESFRASSAAHTRNWGGEACDAAHTRPRTAVRTGRELRISVDAADDGAGASVARATRRRAAQSGAGSSARDGDCADGETPRPKSQKPASRRSARRRKA